MTGHSYSIEATLWIDSSRTRSKTKPFAEGHAIPAFIKAAALLLMKNKMEATNIHSKENTSTGSEYGSWAIGTSSENHCWLKPGKGLKRCQYTQFNALRQAIKQHNAA